MSKKKVATSPEPTNPTEPTALAQPTAQGGALAVPSFMEGVEHETEALSQFIVPPRLTIVQALSDDNLKQAYAEGCVVVMPQMMEIAGMETPTEGKPFYFVPVFFFVEWLTWNPRATRGSLPAIRERSTDPQSQVAIKARNQRLWEEDCPEAPGEKIRNQEHLNYIMSLVGDHPLAGTPIVASFARSEHRSGSNLAALISMRKAPLFGCQFMAVSARRTNAKGRWFGLDIQNPPGDSGVLPFVESEDTFEALKSSHAELKKAHEEAKLRVDYEDPVDETDPSDTKF